jgi:N-acetylmuramoyl-L-alanine amidase
MKLKTIVIDPGHGGKDNGAAWGYAEEDDINLGISFLLRCELDKLGFEVLMSRERDEPVSLSRRINFANQVKADLFVSIHCDAFHKVTAHGMSVHVFPVSGRSRRIAREIREALADRFPDHRDRGVMESNFYVLRETTMPAVLVECEFLSNPDTRRFLREPENQLALAQAISRGISTGLTG